MRLSKVPPHAYVCIFVPMSLTWTTVSEQVPRQEVASLSFLDSSRKPSRDCASVHPHQLVRQTPLLRDFLSPGFSFSSGAFTVVFVRTSSLTYEAEHIAL